MEDPSPDLKTMRRGFTLVELLIALTLVSVVMALAWLVLDSTRKVANEIQQPPYSPLEPLWRTLQQEFDARVSRPTNTKHPALRFSTETGLEMVSMLPGPNEVPLQTELHYFTDEDGLKKVIRTSFPPLNQTNLISPDLKAMKVLGKTSDQIYESWPTENEPPLPLSYEIIFYDREGTSSQREFHLITAYKVNTSNENPDQP